jgi:uncharacterized membrane protein YeiB
MNKPQEKLGNERIVAIDILRGFAVLGILLIRILPSLGTKRATIGGLTI